MNRREFIINSSIVGFGSVLPKLGFSNSDKVFEGFSKIYENGNHEVGLFSEHGDYESEIFSSYRASNGQKWVMTVKDALETLDQGGWQAVGNAGWFEDYHYDRPSALFVEHGDLQQNIVRGRGEGIIKIDKNSKISIDHISEHDYDFSNQAKNYKSAIQGALIQYRDRNLLGNSTQDEMPRSAIAVGEEGIFYFVLKNCDMHKLLSEANRLYGDHVQKFIGTPRRLPDVVQLDAHASASFIMDPEVASSNATKNVEGKYIGSQLEGKLRVGNKIINYDDFDLKERAIANFFAFKKRKNSQIDWEKMKPMD